MEVAIYKKGQGFWTRVLSLIAAAVLLAAGIGWIWQELSAVRWIVDRTHQVQVPAERVPPVVDEASPWGISAFDPETAGAREDAVAIRSVDAGSVAAQFGLRREDAVVAVDGQPVSTAGELVAALQQADPPVTLTYIRPWNAMDLVGLIVVMVLFVVGGGLLLWMMNRPSVSDFLIATESEMRKVNWPTYRELAGSTWIVICGTLILTLILWVINLVFAWLFEEVGVLRLPDA